VCVCVCVMVCTQSGVFNQALANVETYVLLSLIQLIRITPRSHLSQSDWLLEWLLLLCDSVTDELKHVLLLTSE